MIFGSASKYNKDKAPSSDFRCSRKLEEKLEEKKNTAIEAEDKDNIKDEAFKQVQKPIDGMIIMQQIPVQCKI